MILLLLLLCIAGALLLSQGLLQRFGYRNLTYSLSFSTDEATEGDTVILTETICSSKLLPLPWVKAELTTDSALLFAAGQSAVSEETRFISSFFCLYPYRKIERRWTVQCTRRGRFTVAHAVICLSDLFGLTELSQPFPDAHASLTVLPALRDCDLPEPPPFQLTGELLRHRALFPDRFAIAGIRPYADGDRLRDLCMSATARTDEPMVWQFEETALPGLTVLLNLETRPTDRDLVSDRNLFEEAVRVCAAYFGMAAQMRIPVRFYANTTADGMPVQTPYLSADTALHGLLHTLAALPYEISGSFERLLTSVCNEDPTAAIVVISCRPSEALQQFAAEQMRISLIPVMTASSSKACVLF